VQSNQKMIDYVIFGEILDNGEGCLGHHSYLHIFFYTPQNDPEKITHQNHDDMYLQKKIRVLGALYALGVSNFSILIQLVYVLYRVSPNQRSFINLVNNGIFTKIMQFCQYFFSEESYINLLLFQ